MSRRLYLLFTRDYRLSEAETESSPYFLHSMLYSFPGQRFILNHEHTDHFRFKSKEISDFNILYILDHLLVDVWVCYGENCCALLSHVPLFVTLWTVAHQAPLSMEFSRNTRIYSKNTGVGYHFLLQWEK